MGEIKSLARIALAVKQSKPDYYIVRRAVTDWYGTHVELDVYIEKLDSSKCKDDHGGVIVPVYTSPQPVSSQKDWPTEDMVIAGFESEAWDALSSAVLKRQGWPYSCRESAECVTGIFKAMLSVAEKKPL